jgi:RNA polymerase sigma factor (sigma-70 family)
MNLVALCDELVKACEANHIDLETLDPEDIDTLERIGSLIPLPLFIYDFQRFRPVYVNKAAAEFLGFEDRHLYKMPMSFLVNVIHPFTLSVLQLNVFHFNSTPKKTLVNSYHFLSKKYGDYHWIYCATKGIKFMENGQPQFMFNLAVDIEEAVNQNWKLKMYLDNRELISKHHEVFQTLTEREKQVLQHVYRELSSKEIAEQLNMSVGTVETHRKNLMRKLDTKSVVGLAKMALLLGLE